MIRYRAVGNRCAVDFGILGLGDWREEIITLLRREGYEFSLANLIHRAQSQIGRPYKRGQWMREGTPTSFDCSSFTKWNFGQAGIWLPRRSGQQFECGENVDLESLRACDLVFTRGPQNYQVGSPRTKIGHVAIASSPETIIHAVPERGVIEESLSALNSRGPIFAKRVVSMDVETVTSPSWRRMETDDDIKHLALELLTQGKDDEHGGA